MKFTKDQRERLLLTGIVTVICVALGYQFLIRGASEGLKKTRADVVKAQKKYEDAERFLKLEAPAIQERLQGLRKELAAAESGMASPVDPFGWGDRLVREFARGRSVVVHQVLRTDGETVRMLPDFPYKAASFRLTGSASFWDLGKFVADFENAFGFCQIYSLKVSSAAMPTAGTQPGAGDAVPGGEAGRLSFELQFIALAKPNAS